MHNCFVDMFHDALLGEKKIRAERRARMRMMGPSRRMMPEMLMMEMMHGYDLEDADFFFDELPFMMRMGPMRRFGYGGRERKREFDEERNHESEETGVLEPIIRDVPPPVLGREWPNYNDTSHGDGKKVFLEGVFYWLRCLLCAA